MKLVAQYHLAANDMVEKRGATLDWMDEGVEGRAVGQHQANE